MTLLKQEISFLDLDSQKSFSNFIKASKTKEITIVCGAGLSVSAGLPTWEKYLRRIVSEFLLTWKEMEACNPKFRDVAPKAMPIDMMGEYYQYRFPNFEIPDNFIKEDPLILAQLIKNCIEPANWRYLLRNALYGKEQNFSDELISIIFKIVRGGAKSGSIMTYNYDNLIEIFFNAQGFKTSSIVGENHFKTHKHFPIYHLHGILPYKGGLESKVYLSEEDL